MPGTVLFGGPQGPEPSINPRRRNKRNDRQAEGHERVAGTVMVLRIPGPCAVGREGGTVYIGAPAVDELPRLRRSCRLVLQQ